MTGRQSGETITPHPPASRIPPSPSGRGKGGRGEADESCPPPEGEGGARGAAAAREGEGLRSRGTKHGTGRARRLRRDQTDPEGMFWGAVRAHRFVGLKFRRQYPVGRYVVDFVCLDHRLVVEIDGGQHNPHVDAERTAFLEAQGFRVLRFWNAEVTDALDQVLSSIATEIGLSERFHGFARSGETVQYGETVTPHPPASRPLEGRSGNTVTPLPPAARVPPSPSGRGKSGGGAKP